MKNKILTEKELELRLLESFVKSLDDEGLDYYYTGLFGGEHELEPDKDELSIYQREYTSRGFLPPLE